MRLRAFHGWVDRRLPAELLGNSASVRFVLSHTNTLTGSLRGCYFRVHECVCVCVCGCEGLQGRFGICRTQLVLYSGTKNRKKEKETYSGDVAAVNPVSKVVNTLCCVITRRRIKWTHLPSGARDTCCDGLMSGNIKCLIFFFHPSSRAKARWFLFSFEKRERRYKKAGKYWAVICQIHNDFTQPPGIWKT